MIVDGGPAAHEDLEALGLEAPAIGRLGSPDPLAPEKPCCCHPEMPDFRVPGGFECLGCGWVTTRRFTNPEGDHDADPSRP